MKIIKFLLYNVPFTAAISKQTAVNSRHLAVLIKHNGVIGFGSSPVYSGWGNNIHNFINKKVISYFNNITNDDFAKARQYVSTNFLKPFSSIAFALDTALWDLESKLKKVNCYKLLFNKDIPKSTKLTMQIFYQSWNKNKHDINFLKSKQVNRLKVKLGKNFASDFNYFSKIANYAGSDFRFYPDFNKAYNLQQAKEMLVKLQNYNIGLFEDPLKNNSDINKLKPFIKNPIMLDEGIKSINDASKFNGDVINLKLARIGGLTNALHFIKTLKKYRFSVGCAEDIGTAMAAILYLGSYLNYNTEGIGYYRHGFSIEDFNWDIKNGNAILPSGLGFGLNFAPMQKKGVKCYNLLSNKTIISLTFLKYKQKLKAAPKHYFKKLIK